LARTVAFGDRTHYSRKVHDKGYVIQLLTYVQYDDLFNAMKYPA